MRHKLTGGNLHAGFAVGMNGDGTSLVIGAPGSTSSAGAVYISDYYYFFRVQLFLGTVVCVFFILLAGIANWQLCKHDRGRLA